MQNYCTDENGFEEPIMLSELVQTELKSVKNWPIGSIMHHFAPVSCTFKVKKGMICCQVQWNFLISTFHPYIQLVSCSWARFLANFSCPSPWFKKKSSVVNSFWTAAILFVSDILCHAFLQNYGTYSIFKVIAIFHTKNATK